MRGKGIGGGEASSREKESRDEMVTSEAEGKERSEKR